MNVLCHTIVSFGICCMYEQPHTNYFPYCVQDHLDRDCHRERSLKLLQLLDWHSSAFSRHAEAFPHFIYWSGDFSGGLPHSLWKIQEFYLPFHHLELSAFSSVVLLIEIFHFLICVLNCNRRPKLGCLSVLKFVSHDVDRKRFCWSFLLIFPSLSFTQLTIPWWADEDS